MDHYSGHKPNDGIGGSWLSSPLIDAPSKYLHIDEFFFEKKPETSWETTTHH